MALLAFLMWGTVACTSPQASPTAAPTAALIAAQPTATPSPTTAPTATRTNLPSAADLALTQTARATPDATAQALAAAEPLIALALADLSERLKPEDPAPVLLQQSAERWTDDALECGPTAGRPRTVNGYRLLFASGETVYEYHTDQAADVRLCQQSSLYADYATLFVERDPVASELAFVARERLGRDLDLPTAVIELVSARPVTWPDASLGCPADGQTYAPAPARGYQFVFTVNETEYTFHTDFESVIECSPR
jgi:hypothetical protein